jgi:hypothetical protein
MPEITGGVTTTTHISIHGLDQHPWWPRHPTHPLQQRGEGRSISDAGSRTFRGGCSKGKNDKTVENKDKMGNVPFCC